MRQQDAIWPEDEDYGCGADSLKSFLIGLGITIACWGFVAVGLVLTWR